MYWRKALVINRAGKVSGKNKNWFNVKHLDDDTMKIVNSEASSRLGKPQ